MAETVKARAGPQAAPGGRTNLWARGRYKSYSWGSSWPSRGPTEYCRGSFATHRAFGGFLDRYGGMRISWWERLSSRPCLVPSVPEHPPLPARCLAPHQSRRHPCQSNRDECSRGQHAFHRMAYAERQPVGIYRRNRYCFAKLAYRKQKLPQGIGFLGRTGSAVAKSTPKEPSAAPLCKRTLHSDLAQSK